MGIYTSMILQQQGRIRNGGKGMAKKSDPPAPEPRESHAMPMPSYMDRLRASGHSGFQAGLPRHKPDPTDLSQEFHDMEWTPPAMDEDTLRAQGPGQYFGVGGGQEANIAPDPRTTMTGAEFLPDPGEGFRPSNPQVDAIRARAARMPWAVRERAGDAGLRNSLEGNDRDYQIGLFNALTPEQKQALGRAAQSNPMFAQALAVRLNVPELADWVQQRFGRPATPAIPAPDATLAQAPQPPQQAPPQSGLALYANAPQSVGTPRDRASGAAPVQTAQNRLALYKN